MPGKRSDDTAAAIEAVINRYRAEVLGHPVAFDEKGRVERYTFVDDIPSLRPDIRFENGSSVRINGEDVGDLEAFSVSIDTDFSRKIGEAIERREFDTLFEDAGSTIRLVDEPVTASVLRDAINRLRREGFGRDRLSTANPKAGGAAFFVGTGVEQDIRDEADSMSHYLPGEYEPDVLPSIDGYEVVPIEAVDAGKAVLADTDALSRNPVAPDRLLVSEPRGVVAIDRVDTDFEWVEGGR